MVGHPPPFPRYRRDRHSVAVPYLKAASAEGRPGMAREGELLALPLPPDAELPAVLIQIPTFNEGGLLRRTLAAAMALDWPAVVAIEP